MKIITILRIFFSAVFAAMSFITLKAGLHENMFAAVSRLADDPWAVATLWDAYCGFLTFYVWVLYKERGLAARVLWFALIMSLGNLAMSAFALIQLFKLPKTARIEDLLLRRAG